MNIRPFCLCILLCLLLALAGCGRPAAAAGALSGREGAVFAQDAGADAPEDARPAPVADAPEDARPAPEADAPSPQLPDGPLLALTFDDGPGEHTGRLLDVFAEHGGRATFFVIGNLIEGHAGTLRRAAAEGHELAGHGWDHSSLRELDRRGVSEQIQSTRSLLLDVAGANARLLRPPHGVYSDEVQAVAAELDVALVNWSVDTRDWQLLDADAVYEAVMSQAADGAIILCHDLHATTVDAMERAVPDLLAQGYALVTVSELLTAGGRDIVPGDVYFKR